MLQYPETKNITELYHGGGGSIENDIYNPFLVMDSHDEQKYGSRQLLIILDDLQEHIYKSQLVSQIFSKGRHLNISVIIILQSYFVSGSGTNILPQIKSNSTLQIFTKHRSMNEVSTIASRLEYDKSAKSKFVNLFKQTVQDKRFGYLAARLDVSDPRIRYCSNLIDEDNSSYLTVYI